MQALKETHSEINTLNVARHTNGTGSTDKKKKKKKVKWGGKTDSYFWIHGACNHESDKCFYLHDGHKKEATRQNKMEVYRRL